MAKPRKYQPLTDYLAGQPAATTTVTLTLAEIEGLIWRSLPASAYLRTWWHTRSTPLTRHVTVIGWQVERVDLRRRVVTFVRTAAAADSSTSLLG